MQTLSYNGILKKVPNNWTEIRKNRKLLMYILSLFFQKFTEEEIKHLIVFRILKIGKAKQLLITKDIERNPKCKHSENLFRAGEIYNFIFKQRYEITENLFPRFKQLHAPSSVFGDTCAYEYALAEKAFFDFAETDNVQFLNRLISILYRSKSFFKKKRKPFDENNLAKHIKQIEKIPFVEKWCVLRWFAFERENIIKSHPYTFPQKENKNKKETVNVGSIWTDIILSMSQVGEEDKVANTKLSIILRRIENSNREYEKAKQQSKKSKKQ